MFLLAVGHVILLNVEFFLPFFEFPLITVDFFANIYLLILPKTEHIIMHNEVKSKNKIVIRTHTHAPIIEKHLFTIHNFS